MQKLLWLLILLLVVLHQDNWFWDDTSLVFGFMPIGLFYHACISMAAAAVWYLATKFCWPAELEQVVRGSPDPARTDGTSGDRPQHPETDLR